MYRLSNTFPTVYFFQEEDIFPPRNEKILRTYDLILPKFHLILPKFHLIPPKKFLSPPWRVFISSGAIGKFLRGERCLLTEMTTSLTLQQPYHAVSLQQLLR